MFSVTRFQASARRPDASAMSAQQAAAERTTSSARSGVLAGHSVRSADGGSGDIGFPDHSQIRRDDLAASRPLHDRRVTETDLASESKAQIKELLGELSALMRQSAPIADCVAVLENARSETVDTNWKDVLIEQLNERIKHGLPLLNDTATPRDIVGAMYRCVVAERFDPSRPPERGLFLENFLAIANSVDNDDRLLMLLPNKELAVVKDGEAGPSGDEKAARRQTINAFMRALRFGYTDPSSGGPDPFLGSNDPWLVVGAMKPEHFSGELGLSVGDCYAARSFIDRVKGLFQIRIVGSEQDFTENTGFRLASRYFDKHRAELRDDDEFVKGFGIPYLLRQSGEVGRTEYEQTPADCLRFIRDALNTRMSPDEFRRSLAAEYGRKPPEELNSLIEGHRQQGLRKEDGAEQRYLADVIHVHAVMKQRFLTSDVPMTSMPAPYSREGVKVDRL